MGKIRRYYYANKTKIWRCILIVAFILVIIQFLNYFQKNKGITTNEKISASEQNTINTLIEDTSLTTNKSQLGTGVVDTNQLEKHVEIIDNFLALCNNKEFNKAYELLSDECKETLFNTYDNFENAYCNKIFNSYKTYTCENWSGNTYKVRITEDPLATGNTSKDMSIQEYITIVNNNGEYKLNINNYIGRKEINAEKTQDDVTVKVISSDTFIDYEIYNIQVKNNTKNTIYLDNGENTSTIYIEDSNGIKYEAASSEIIFSTLKIYANSTINYSIKYNNSYRTNRKISKLVFERLILNYDKYINNTNNYEYTTKFEVTF